MSVKKTIVLFGSTGQGRSTIANMLIQGDIREENNAFPISDSATGTSSDITYGTNEEFEVHDLVGLGGGPSGTIEKIKEYFAKTPTQIDYICFVKRKSRFTEEDTKAFEVFRSIFKKGESNFVIIVTHSKPDWVKANEKTIHDHLGQYPVIPVDFPHEAGDIFLKWRNKNTRDNSLRHLKDHLSMQNFNSITFKAHLPPSKAEAAASQILGCIPLIGSTYKLLSAIAYYIIGNEEIARERIMDGGVGITSDIINLGTLGAGTRVFGVINAIMAEKNKVEATLKKVKEVVVLGNDMANAIMDGKKTEEVALGNSVKVLTMTNTVMMGKDKTEEMVNTVTLGNGAKALDAFTKEVVKKDADTKVISF